MESERGWLYHPVECERGWLYHPMESERGWICYSVDSERDWLCHPVCSERSYHGKQRQKLANRHVEGLLKRKQTITKPNLQYLE